MNLMNLANMASVTIFRQRLKFWRVRSREGQRQCGKFDECGNLTIFRQDQNSDEEAQEKGTKKAANSTNAENLRNMAPEFDEFSPKTKMQANELKTRVPTKLRT